jgi:hypothetical protein
VLASVLRLDGWIVVTAMNHIGLACSTIEASGCCHLTEKVVDR